MKRIIINADNCNGCKNCAIGCMMTHRKDGGKSIYDLDLSDPANESGNVILLNAENHYKPLFCRHCASPECLKSCMSGAITKDPESGLVRYDTDKCGACFMCVMSCPYGVPKPDVTKTRVVKCDFCMENDEDPNCVKMCPNEAIYVREV